MKKTILIGIVFLLLVSFVIGIDVSPSCENVEAYDYKKLTECQEDTRLRNENQVMAEANDIILNEIVESTTGKVDATKASDILNFFQIIFSGFFLAIITLTGYKFMTSAAYPEKRNEAKRQLKNVLVIAVIVVALPWIIGEMMYLAESMSSSISMNIIEPGYFQLESFAGEGDSLERYSNLDSTSGWFVNVGKSYVVSMYAREVIVLFLLSISPIILLLFYFLPTQEYGKMALSLFVVELFAPVLYVLVFKFASIAVPSQGAEISKIMVLTAALLFNVFLHMILIIVSVLKAVLSVIKDYASGGRK